LLSTGFLALPKNSGSLIGSLKYDRKRLKRKPFGASFVSLTPFCNMVTGNWVLGYDVNQRRKSGWMVSGLNS